MATCPSGHESASDDFCDVCGVLIGAAPSFGPGATLAGAAPATGTRTGTPAGACPRCGTARDGQFCESCGYEFAAGPPAAAPAAAPGPVAPAQAPRAPAPPGPGAGAAWTAVVTADRAYYDAVQAAGGPDAADIAFPVYCPQRRFRLAGREVRIGRHSRSSGIDPEIDLSVPPADPGVSRLHAVLLRAEDGTWSVVDPGSANGTLLNGTEIARDRLVPVGDGDRLHLGAWTELRLVREA